MKTITKTFSAQSYYNDWVEKNSLEVFVYDEENFDEDVDKLLDVTIGGISPFNQLMISDCPDSL